MFLGNLQGKHIVSVWSSSSKRLFQKTTLTPVCHNTFAVPHHLQSMFGFESPTLTVLSSESNAKVVNMIRERTYIDFATGGILRAELIERGRRWISLQGMHHKCYYYSGMKDANLTRIFSISYIWDTVVLIDEADVLFEEHSLDDLERKAMFVVFLR
ncbi:hypothetical protein DFH11DRAFT_1749061 [Phellopilus nigrolimitatus]|nr:hypothetical protein DFH11DRAFT_1749061 [Phellopilus nigrolimitatus]